MKIHANTDAYASIATETRRAETPPNSPSPSQALATDQVSLSTQAQQIVDGNASSNNANVVVQGHMNNKPPSSNADVNMGTNGHASSLPPS